MYDFNIFKYVIIWRKIFKRGMQTRKSHKILQLGEPKKRWSVFTKGTGLWERQVHKTWQPLRDNHRPRPACPRHRLRNENHQHILSARYMNCAEYFWASFHFIVGQFCKCILWLYLFHRGNWGSAGNSPRQ